MAGPRDGMSWNDGGRMALACAFCGERIPPGEEHECEAKKKAEAEAQADPGGK